jgi:hypothetical protein
MLTWPCIVHWPTNIKKTLSAHSPQPPSRRAQYIASCFLKSLIELLNQSYFLNIYGNKLNNPGGCLKGRGNGVSHESGTCSQASDSVHSQIPHHSCKLGTFFSQESFVWQNHIIQLINISKKSPKNKHCIRMECKWIRKIWKKTGLLVLTDLRMGQLFKHRNVMTQIYNALNQDQSLEHRLGIPQNLLLQINRVLQ